MLHTGEVPGRVNNLRGVFPNGSPFAFSVGSNRAAQPADVPVNLVAAYESARNPGKCEVRVVPGQAVTFDLVPTEVRDEGGQPRPFTAILDTPIVMPGGRRLATDVFLQFRDTLAMASGVRIELGAGFNGNGLRQKEIEGGAVNEPARHVLRRLLADLDSQTRGGSLPASWRLLCDPGRMGFELPKDAAGDKFCVLNLHNVLPK